MLKLICLFALMPAAAADEPREAPAPAATVRHISEAPTRATPSGTASVMRIAGQEEGAKNAFFAVLRIQPGGKVPLHRDATEEYIYVESGTGTITIDGTDHDLRPGSGVFMPANAEVSFAVTGDGPVTVVQFFAGQGPEAKYAGWVAQ